MTSEETLAQAIENLTHKKHVISDEAIKAKEELDARKREQQHVFDAQKSVKPLAVVEEFSTSVRLLSSIFQHSRFDELALFISNPTRVLILNFCIGLLRGMGFAVGVLIIVGFLAFLVQSSMPSSIYDHLAKISLILIHRLGIQ